MKKIEAFVKPHRLEAVAQALHHVKGLSGVTATDARGFGRGRGGSELNPTQEMIKGFIETLRLEIFCDDAIADEVVTTIEKAAHTGLRGDGKIYVMPVEQSVRISTGERGQAAV
jgi:nitrogen regulatory protein PII